MPCITKFRVVMLICTLAAAPAMAANWPGSYAGIAVELVNQDIDWNTTIVRYRREGTPDRAASLSDSDVSVGLFAGYNWDLSTDWVIGAEAGFQMAETQSMINHIPGLSHFTINSQVEVTTEDGINLLARAGRRMGPNLLLYGTAGLSALKLTVTSPCPGLCNNTPGSHPTFTEENTVSGYAFGVGAEYGKADKQWRAEYRLSLFGDSSFNVVPEGYSSASVEASLEAETGVFQLGFVSAF